MTRQVGSLMQNKLSYFTYQPVNGCRLHTAKVSVDVEVGTGIGTDVEGFIDIGVGADAKECVDISVHVDVETLVLVRINVEWCVDIGVSAVVERCMDIGVGTNRC